MPLSWNEIRHNAIRFSREWAGETREEAEVKPFWDAFFAVFGISRRAVASFEEPVGNLRGQHGYIDLFYGVEIAEWPARIAKVGLWLMDHQMNTGFPGRSASALFRQARLQQLLLTHGGHAGATCGG